MQKSIRSKKYTRAFMIHSFILIILTLFIIVGYLAQGQLQHQQLPQLQLAMGAKVKFSKSSSSPSFPTHHKNSKNSKIHILSSHPATSPVLHISHKTSSSGSKNVPSTTTTTTTTTTNSHTDNFGNKVAMLTFGDISDTQFTTAKPILDQYGFKGSFFVTCDWVGHATRMNWPQIEALHNEGHDIESKTMTHRDLNHLSATALDFEVGQSKECLGGHGIDATIFAPPHGDAWDNATVINAISKYYNFADNGFSELMFLHCDGGVAGAGQNLKKVVDLKPVDQVDCRTYLADGTLTYSNRYSLKEWSHNSADVELAHNDPQIFQKFIEIVNSQNQFNGNGQIMAIPIIAYHTIDNSGGPSSTDVNEFAQEMKYLHDNGFKVITMSSLAYDPNNNFIYLGQIPGVTVGASG
jgi:peptidoglycan/xylan/chitin deacetylase (PgdA/CDA1 family)